MKYGLKEEVVRSIVMTSDQYLHIFALLLIWWQLCIRLYMFTPRTEHYTLWRSGNIYS